TDLGRFVGGSFPFKGLIDEARIYGGLCSSNWVWANWMTVASNAALENYASVSQQQPILSLANDGNAGFFLSWPGNAVGFGLYEATNLVPPVVWTASTNQPVLTNNQWTVSLPTNSSSTRFYRLQSL